MPFGVTRYTSGVVKIVLVLSSIGLVLYAAVVVAFAVLQRRLEYFPSREDAAGRGDATFLPWRDSEGIFLGYTRASSAPRQVVLFFHGNGGEALHRNWIGELLPADSAVVLVEYPGYGARPGEPNQTDILREAVRVFDRAHLRWPGVPIVVLGESLGTGVATHVAAERPVERIALIAPYTSIAEVGAKHYPWLPVRFVLHDRYPSTEYLRRASAPLHAVHGKSDEIIPVALAETLVATYGGSTKALTLLDGVGHNDIAAALLTRPEAEPFRRFLRGPAL